MHEDTGYLDQVEGLFFQIQVGKCLFEAFLLQRAAGGFDLFMDRERSELECLEVDQITWLRQRAEKDGTVFIEHFPEAKLNSDLKQRIQNRFGEWLQQHLNVPFTTKGKVRWAQDDSYEWSRGL